MLAGAFELVLLDEVPVVGAGAFFEEVGEGGAGIAFGGVSVLVKLGDDLVFHKSALDSVYKSSQVRVDDVRRYTVAQTTRIQEIAEYGSGKQHTLPEGEGPGLIWRLFSATRYEERDGGVYIEIEAIALSRDVPASLRWLVYPVIRRVAKASLTTTLEETRDAVHSNSGVRIARSK